MRYALPSVCLIALAGPAVAADASAVVRQFGVRSETRIDQLGAGNSAVAIQGLNAANALTEIQQIGIENQVSVEQADGASRATIRIEGTRNGRGALGGSVMQEGLDAAATVTVTGVRNDFAIEQSGLSPEIDLLQEGDRNAASIQQDGAAYMQVQQQGPDNVATMSQSAAAGSLLDLLQFGSENTSETMQFGGGNTSIQTQIGDRNSISLEQFGGANEANLEQTGTGRAITISQTGGAVITVRQGP